MPSVAVAATAPQAANGGGVTGGTGEEPANGKGDGDDRRLARPNVLMFADGGFNSAR